MEAISVFFPAIPQAKFSDYVSGLSTYTPDGQILLGPIPGVRNLFTAAGCCGSGIALSAGIGSAISALARNAEPVFAIARSEEHTSELQSLIRNSYAVICIH